MPASARSPSGSSSASRLRKPTTRRPDRAPTPPSKEQTMSELSSHSQPPADRSVKIPHLVFGLLFLGIAGVWALVLTDVITEDRLTIIAPAVLIGAGVIGLAASLASSRNRRTNHHHHTSQDPNDHAPVESGLDGGVVVGVLAGVVVVVGAAVAAAGQARREPDHAGADEDGRGDDGEPVLGDDVGEDQCPDPGDAEEEKSEDQVRDLDTAVSRWL